MHRSALFLSLAAAAGMACFSGGSGDPNATSNDAGSGLPCDVAQALSTCQACHGDPLAGGAPLALVTLADLTTTGTWPDDPTLTVAQRAVARMNGTDPFPMPPLPLDASQQSDIDTIQAWIDAGYPAGTCTPDPGGTNPFDTPAGLCTRGKGDTTFTGDPMLPGEGCIVSGCHASTHRFTIAGTIYPTAHEKDDCNGGSLNGSLPAVTTAKIVITDQNGTLPAITPDSVGNFYSTHALSPPYTVQLLYNNKERDMTGYNIAKQPDGNCNSCHTENGDNGAPGRIMLP